MTVTYDNLTDEQIDALVAERVFNLVRVDESYHHDTLGSCKRVVWRNQIGVCMFTGDCFLPKYSTDIAAAWEVVEKMKTLGFCIGLRWENRLCGGNPLVEFDREANYTGHNPGERNNQHDHGDADAKTAPRAICIAALKALEAK